MAASNTLCLLAEVMPRAIKKYGGVDPDALRKAALEVDLPEGATMRASASNSSAKARRWQGRMSARFRGHPVCRRQVVRGVA